MSKYIVHSFLRVATEFVPETFGRLTTLGPKFLLRIGNKPRGCQVCQCACGDIGVYIAEALKGARGGQCRSCATKTTATKLRTHGETNKTKEFTAWWNMKRRCYDSRATRYNSYGGRGIGVCDRWRDPVNGYVNFLEDMGRCPPECNSIDRIDVNGDYHPRNCRWATSAEQARNKRNNRMLTAFGKTQCLTDWAIEYGMSLNTLNGRIQRGWSGELALTTPIRGAKQRTGDTSQGDVDTAHCT